jgi:hypothetical protein
MQHASMMWKRGREEIVETLMMEVANPKLFLDEVGALAPKWSISKPRQRQTQAPASNHGNPTSRFFIVSNRRTGPLLRYPPLLNFDLTQAVGHRKTKTPGYLIQPSGLNILHPPSQTKYPPPFNHRPSRIQPHTVQLIHPKSHHFPPITKINPIIEALLIQSSPNISIIAEFLRIIFKVKEASAESLKRQYLCFASLEVFWYLHVAVYFITNVCSATRMFEPMLQ